MQIETLRSLREIAAAATGADRELDGDLFNVARCELPQTTRHVSAWVCHGYYYKRTLFDGRGEPDSTDVFHVPSYTASLDAAVALVERMLPGEAASIVSHAVHSWSLWSRDLKALPRYLICTLLDALITQAEQKTSPSD